MKGAPVCRARSITLHTFCACTSPIDPPNTVKSCEATKTFLPSIVPYPVIAPSPAGRRFSIPKSCERWTANGSVSTKEPTSIRMSSRSRAVSFPLSCCRWAASRPPGWRVDLRRLWSSSIRSSIVRSAGAAAFSVFAMGRSLATPPLAGLHRPAGVPPTPQRMHHPDGHDRVRATRERRGGQRPARLRVGVEPPRPVGGRVLIEAEVSTFRRAGRRDEAALTPGDAYRARDPSLDRSVRTHGARDLSFGDVLDRFAVPPGELTGVVQMPSRRRRRGEEHRRRRGERRYQQDVAKASLQGCRPYQDQLPT